MNYNFANGSTEQKKLWLEAAHHLLNFAFENIALTVNVEFVNAGDVDDGHGGADLAVTTWTYGSAVSSTKVRNDAPGFGPQQAGLKRLAASMGLPYSATQHFHETAIHELGHSIFAALAPTQRLAVVRLFGANTDDVDVIFPTDKPWEDRIGEGIAETFKEAFLPARFRVFPNRTRRRISYSVFPLFREIIRGGAGGGVGGGFSYVYGSDDFRVDLTKWGLDRLPYHESDKDDEAFVFYPYFKGFEDCWGVDMSQFTESSHHPFSIEPEGIITS